MRGTSPTANDTTMPNICVGAVDANSTDQKSYFSDCGPGVDIWAPGTNILSSYLSGASDPRNTSYFFGKINGTSMASPQVCGVLACALEVYPDMTPTQAKAYIVGIAKANQLTVTSGGPADIRDTQGAPNLFLYYKKERESLGHVSPKINYQIRPSLGVAYPRTRMKRYG
jgi:subtilisin family serine protease